MSIRFFISQAGQSHFDKPEWSGAMAGVYRSVSRDKDAGRDRGAYRNDGRRSNDCTNNDFQTVLSSRSQAVASRSRQRLGLCIRAFVARGIGKPHMYQWTGTTAAGDPESNAARVSYATVRPW